MLVTLALTGCAKTPPQPQIVTPPPAPDTAHQIALPPEAAAACVAQHAARAAEGAVGQIQPLYGTERLAVIVRDRPAGEALAVAYIAARGSGSEVRLTTTKSYAGDREALARRLLAGC
jgi:hypothetical protein